MFQSDNSSNKLRKKMYKSGKKWVIAGVLTAGLLSTATAAQIYADTIGQTTVRQAASDDNPNTKVNYNMVGGDSFDNVDNTVVNATTPEQVGQNFDTNGSATGSNGQYTLVPNKNNQTGQVLFNRNLDMSQEFSMEGTIDLHGVWGDGWSGWKSVGDGFGVVISPATPRELLEGKSGNSMGIGGISNSIAAVWDLYNNESDQNNIQAGNGTIFNQGADVGNTANDPVVADTVIGQGMFYTPGSYTKSKGGASQALLGSGRFRDGKHTQSVSKFIQTDGTGQTVTNNIQVAPYIPSSSEWVTNSQTQEKTDGYKVSWTPNNVLPNGDIQGTLTFTLINTTDDTYSLPISYNYTSKPNASVGIVSSNGADAKGQLDGSITSFKGTLKKADVNVSYEGLPDDLKLDDTKITTLVGSTMKSTVATSDTDLGMISNLDDTYTYPVVPGYHVAKVSNNDLEVHNSGDGNELVVTYEPDIQQQKITIEQPDGTTETKLINGKTDQNFPDFEVPQISGRTSYVDGRPATSITGIKADRTPNGAATTDKEPQEFKVTYGDAKYYMSITAKNDTDGTSTPIKEAFEIVPESGKTVGQLLREKYPDLPVDDWSVGHNDGKQTVSKVSDILNQDSATALGNNNSTPETALQIEINYLNNAKETVSSKDFNYTVHYTFDGAAKPEIQPDKTVSGSVECIVYVDQNNGDAPITDNNKYAVYNKDGVRMPDETVPSTTPVYNAVQVDGTPALSVDENGNITFTPIYTPTHTGWSADKAQSANNVTTFDGATSLVDTVNYTAVAGESVTVEYVYVDKDGSRKMLLPSLVLNGQLGENYSTTPAAIPGYELTNTIGNANGQFTDTPQTVTYVYEKLQQTGTVIYKDNQGNVIRTEDITGYTDDPVEYTPNYDTVKWVIVSNETTGAVWDKDTNVNQEFVIVLEPNPDSVSDSLEESASISTENSIFDSIDKSIEESVIKSDSIDDSQNVSEASHHGSEANSMASNVTDNSEISQMTSENASTINSLSGEASRGKSNEDSIQIVQSQHHSVIDSLRSNDYESGKNPDDNSVIASEKSLFESLASLVSDQESIQDSILSEMDSRNDLVYSRANSMSVEDSQAKSTSIENSQDKSTSIENSQDKSRSIEESQDKSHSIEESQDKSTSIEESQDKSTSIENSQDKSRSIEESQDKSHSIEESQDKSISIENSQDKSTSIENSQDKSTSIENSQDKSQSIEESQDKSTSIENSINDSMNSSSGQSGSDSTDGSQAPDQPSTVKPNLPHTAAYKPQDNEYSTPVLVFGITLSALLVFGKKKKN